MTLQRRRGVVSDATPRGRVRKYTPTAKYARSRLAPSWEVHRIGGGVARGSARTDEDRGVFLKDRRSRSPENHATTPTVHTLA